MFEANYHTHTKRCGHASGEDEDYIIEAIGHGFRYLGFSDHAMLPDFSEPYTRGDYSLFNDYLNSINELKIKYQDKIKIYLGFEAESFPIYYPFYKEIVTNGLLDYMILGNHCAMDDKKKIYARFNMVTGPSQLYLYRDLAIKAISSGLFRIFAHPDYFMASIDNFDNDCKRVSREIIEACVAYDVPLEVNLAGIRNGKKKIGSAFRWLYPTHDFFDMVSKYKAKCVFGMDAHSPRQLANDDAEFMAVKFAKEHGLNMIDIVDSIHQH